MSTKKRYEDYIKFSVYIVVVILINMAGMTLFSRWDLTENNIFSLSDASKKVVSTLEEPLTIKVFFTKNLPAPHNTTEQYLHDLLEEYALFANKNFNYTFYDVSPDENDLTQDAEVNRNMAKNYGVYPVQIRNFEKDEVTFQKAYMGLVIIHGDMIGQIPTIASTDGLEYELTMAIRKLNNKTSALLNIKDKIKIKLFLSSSLYNIAPHMRLQHLDQFSDEVEKLIKKINAKSYDKIAYEYIDPSANEQMISDAEKYKVPAFKWPAMKNKGVSAGKGMAGLVMIYEDKVITIPLISAVRIPLIGSTQYSMPEIKEVEDIINENIESLIDINEDIGVLSDHGAETIYSFSWGQRNESGLSVFQTLTSQNYSIKNVTLTQGNIPDSINCLVLIKPVEPFSDYELFQIDQFLMRGNSLALFLDPFHEILPDRQQGFGMGQMPQYIPISTGLEKLLRHYGVTVSDSYVLDENCFKQNLPQEYGGGQRPVYFAPIINEKSINHHHPIMQNIKGLIAMKISPLFLDNDIISKNGLHSEKLFSSSNKSWEMADRINFDLRFSRKPQRTEEYQSFPLAYIIEGEFPSYFEGKPIPGKSLDNEEAEKAKAKKAVLSRPSAIKTEGDFISKGKPGKIFIMASTEMLKDNLQDPNGRDPNTVFIMNVLDYLNGRDQIVAMRSKEQRFNPLHDTSSGVRTFVKFFNIIGLPILVVGFGLIILFRRHSRKNRIQMMFNQ